MADTSERTKILVFTRFSVYNYPSGVIRKHQKQIRSEADYLRVIYGAERLDEKFAAFEERTVPSMKAQSVPPTRWMVFTSPQLPSAYRRRLARALKGVPGAEVVMVRDHAQMLERSDEALKEAGGATVTVTLDDDDALHPRFLETVAARARPGHILSPRAGYMLHEDGRATRFSYPRDSCAATGLAFADGNVLRLGNHTAIHTRPGHPPIDFLPYKNVFVRVRHGANLAEHRRGNKLFPFSFENFLNSDLKKERAQGSATRKKGRTQPKQD
jgi:hypothetical protein